jgi:parallel beta-helix repeat protein
VSGKFGFLIEEPIDKHPVTSTPMVVRMLFRPLIVLFLVAMFSSAVHAKTLYVNAQTGNDSTSYAQNGPGQPWRTIGRAAWGSTNRASPNSSEAARGGDVVLIAPGIYWETGDPAGGRFTVSLNPVNDGTAQNPIIFRGEGLVYIRMQAGHRGAMIGCNSRSHIIWDNFQIDDYYGGSQSDTGPVVFSGGNYCQIINSDIKGHPGTYFHGYPTYGGNYRGISLEPANNTLIRNNRIHNFRGGTNEAGIMAYDSNDNIIENNEIFNNGAGVFLKGIHDWATQRRNIVRKNIVRDNFIGIRVLGSEDADVYQNILIGNGDGLYAGFSPALRTRFVNNTLYNNARGFTPQSDELVDILVFGNIFAASSGSAIHTWGINGPSAQDVSYNRNLYFNNASHASYDTAISFSSWQSTHRQDQNGLSANPQFLNAAGNDFRLGASSPARGLSIDILDLTGDGSTTNAIAAGAYVTGNEIIGLLGPGGSSSLPQAPGNVVVD